MPSAPVQPEVPSNNLPHSSAGSTVQRAGRACPCVGDPGLADFERDLIFPLTFDDFLFGPSCQKENADIKLNGQDGPVDLASSDPIEIGVSLMNVPDGKRVDFWLYAQAAAGIFWFDPNGNWALSGQPIAAQTGAVVEVLDRPVYEGPLPRGSQWAWVRATSRSTSSQTAFSPDDSSKTRSTSGW